MPRGQARFKAAYTIPELAALTGMSRYQVRRMLENNQVHFTRNGRGILVFRSELKRGLREVWDTLLDLQSLADTD